MHQILDAIQSDAPAEEFANLALPAEFARCRGKRLRLAFLNVAARVVTHARQTWLRLPRSHAWADAFIEALTRIRQLPAFA